MDKKTTYKKIKPGIFEKISTDDIVVDVLNLKNLEQSRDVYKDRYERLDTLIKELKKLMQTGKELVKALDDYKRPTTG